MPRVCLPTLLSRKLAYRNPIPSDGVAVCGPIKISTIEPHSLSRYVTQTEPLAAFVCSDSYGLPEIDHVRTGQALPRRALADQFPPHYRSTFIAPTFIAAANFIILGHIIRRLGPGYSRLAPRSCEHLHVPSGREIIVLTCPVDARIFVSVDIFALLVQVCRVLLLPRELL